MANELWAMKKLVESIGKSLAIGDDEGYGAATLGWVRAASSLAGLGRPVTYGTVTEGATNFTWTNSPTDRLVVKRRDGTTFTITVLNYSGDVLSTSFPQYSGDVIRFSFSWAWCELSATYGRSVNDWSGWFVNADGVRVEVDVRGSFFTDFTASGWAFHQDVEQGVVRANGYEVSMKSDFSRLRCSGTGCITPGDARDTVMTLKKNGISWSVSAKDESLMDSNSRLVGFTFTGDVTKNGARVGGLSSQLVTQSSSGKLYSLKFSVGDDTILVGQRIVQ